MGLQSLMPEEANQIFAFVVARAFQLARRGRLGGQTSGALDV